MQKLSPKCGELSSFITQTREERTPDRHHTEGNLQPRVEPEESNLFLPDEASLQMERINSTLSQRLHTLENKYMCLAQHYREETLMKGGQAEDTIETGGAL